MSLILISQQHNEDRLNGTLNHLTRGALAPKIYVYSSGGTPQRPVAITDAPVGTLLAIITLNDPPGAVAANKLTFTVPPDALILADGTARWARFINGEGNASMDVDVTDAAGDGEIKMLTTTLLAGGATRLVSCQIG